jgi:hypothetical protein
MAPSSDSSRFLAIHGPFWRINVASDSTERILGVPGPKLLGMSLGRLGYEPFSNRDWSQRATNNP